MRERWFGATGRRVPAIAVDGTIDVEGALVVDTVHDIDTLREAHLAGTPVVTRAASAEEVVRALTRPEVACVLVTDPALLEINLADLTYG
jgi:hypothetical protein